MAKLKTTKLATEKVEETPTTAVALPVDAQDDVLAQYAEPKLPEQRPETSGGSGPWVSCLEDKSGNKEAALGAGVALGQFYLNEGGGITPLPTLEYHLVDHAKFYTVMNQQGKIVEVADNDDGDADEHYVTLLLVKLGDRYIPTRSEFRKSKSPAVKNAIAALYDAASDGGKAWGAKGDAHKATLSVPLPFARFIATAGTRKGVVKSGKMAGSQYFAGTCTVRPTTLAEIRSFITVASTADFKAALRAAKESFNARVAELEAM
jgi:hypothetical protein